MSIELLMNHQMKFLKSCTKLYHVALCGPLLPSAALCCAVNITDGGEEKLGFKLLGLLVIFTLTKPIICLEDLSDEKKKG